MFDAWKIGFRLGSDHQGSRESDWYRERMFTVALVLSFSSFGSFRDGLYVFGINKVDTRLPHTHTLSLPYSILASSKFHSWIEIHK